MFGGGGGRGEEGEGRRGREEKLGVEGQEKVELTSQRNCTFPRPQFLKPYNINQALFFLLESMKRVEEDILRVEFRSFNGLPLQLGGDVEKASSTKLEALLASPLSPITSPAPSFRL